MAAVALMPKKAEKAEQDSIFSSIYKKQGLCYHITVREKRK
jgi:hypothetical protein